MLGDLPRHPNGANVGRLDRKATAALYGLSDRELKKAYENWQEVFRIPDSSLTFEQYLNKLKEANLSPLDVTCYKGGFSLARYGDDGPYHNNSCRFIPTVDNLYEQIYNGKNHYVKLK